MADGRTPSSLLFADETGLTARELGGEGERLLHMQEARELEDILLLGDGDEALVSWPGGVALVSLRGAGIVRELKLHSHRDRITPWHDEGSVLVWGFSLMSPAEGDLLLLGRPVALALAASVSNLRARLDENHRVVLRLR